MTRLNGRSKKPETAQTRNHPAYPSKRLNDKMLDILHALKESRRFHASRLQLDVIPQHKTLSLSGYIRLRTYSPIADEENRFTGEESRQIKEALRQTLPKDCLIEVKLEPNVQMFKGGAYLFRISRPFNSKTDMDREVAEMIDNGSISEHIFHIASKWASEISSGHDH